LNKQEGQARKRQSNKGWHTKENLRNVSRIRSIKTKNQEDTKQVE